MDSIQSFPLDLTSNFNFVATNFQDFVLTNHMYLKEITTPNEQKQARKGFRPVSARWVFYGFSIKTAFIGISFVCTARYGFQH